MPDINYRTNRSSFENFQELINVKASITDGIEICVGMFNVPKDFVLQLLGNRFFRQL